MKTKKEICVLILDEKELQQAREILERNGEKIDYKLFVLSENVFYNYLQYCHFHFEWYLGRKRDLTEIPLSELESVLRGESESKELFKKPFRRGKERKDTILDANGHYLFRLNKGQFSDELIDKIVESINND